MEIFEDWGRGAQGEWSPDGRGLAFLAYQPTGPHARKEEIYLVDADGSDLDQLSNFETNYPGSHPSEFTWSPDGKWLALPAHKDDDPNDSRPVLLSSGEGRLIDIGLEWDNPFWPLWSLDSKQIAFTSYLIHEGQRDIYAIDIATKQTRQLADTAEYKGSLSWC